MNQILFPARLVIIFGEKSQNMSVRAIDNLLLLEFGRQSSELLRMPPGAAALSG